MDRHIDRANWIERNARIGDGFSDNVPLEAELPAKDGCELIQNLHADHAAGQDRLPRDLAFPPAPLSVDQDVGVKERGHRPLASSRSNA